MASAVDKNPVIKSERHPLDATCINTIRTLAMDAVQAANSGHPGTPMAMAPVAYYLWQYVLRFDPSDPIWPNRDRFVLSAGHASMLLYAMLHLTGVKAVSKDYEPLGELAVPLDSIKKFRQWHSRCPGHPEYRWTSGVETTTGPLGQGLANSVGMAMAGRWSAAHFNRPGFDDLIDFNVYALGGDGCMMEGISSEAASLAGHLKLSNLCWIYDNNHITIEGNTALAFSEDVANRFLAYGWNVTRVGDANDLDLLAQAFATFLATTDRPTLIIVDSHIGWGAPNKQDTSAAHGEPLGEEEIRLTKRAYGWPEDAKFFIPDGVYDRFQEGIGRRGKELRDSWFAGLGRYKAENPALADELNRMQHRQLPDGWDKDLPTFPADAKGMATRVSSGKVLNAVAKNVPWLIGGAADLAPSTKTYLTFDGAGAFEAGNYAGRNLHFGVREHAMGAILNGMALVKVRAVWRRVPDLQRLRPDADPTGRAHGGAGHLHLHARLDRGRRGRPDPPADRAAPLLAGDPRPDRAPPRRRQRGGRGLAVHHAAPPRSRRAGADPPGPADPRPHASTPPPSGLQRGGYVLADPPGGDPDVILIATGSEVSLCVECLRGAPGRGGQGPGRQPPLVGDLREAARRVSRAGAPGAGDGPRGRRAGLALRLEPLRRPHRPGHRHVDVRRLGPAEGAATRVQVHRRGRRRRRQGATGEGEQGLRRARHGDLAC